MELNWGTKSKANGAEALIARGKYAKALEILEGQLAKAPTSVHLRQRVADTMVMAGMFEDAVQILLRLSDDFAKNGFAAKAIAILKKIDRIAPGRADVYQKLANELLWTAQRGPEKTWAKRGPPEPPLEEEKPEAASSEDREAEEDAAVYEIEGDGEEVEFSSDLQSANAPLPVTTALFESFTPDELLPLLRGLRLVTFLPGDIVVSEGEPGDSLFILTTGRVKTFVRDAAGHFGKVRELTDGDFFGEISFLRSTPRTATITAAAPCEILILDKSTLLLICQTHPHVLEVLEQFSAQRENSVAEIEARKSTAIDGRA
jgi:cAMP-dependent protein kinase regulator